MMIYSQYLLVLREEVCPNAHSWLVLVFWALIIAPVQAAVELRIAISKGVSAVSVGSSTDAVVKDGAGCVLI